MRDFEYAGLSVYRTLGVQDFGSVGRWEYRTFGMREFQYALYMSVYRTQ